MSPQPFPHLLPAESLLWVRFLARYGSQWDGFQYDVRVGEGHPIDPHLPDFTQDMIRKLSPKRIDVVGFVGRQPTIFEVNPHGSRTLVGALLLYEWLFMRQFPDLPPPHLVAVTGRCDPDCLRFLTAKGVSVFALGETVPV